MGLRKYLKSKDFSIFGSDTEGEITNILIAFLVSVSLLIFPLPLFGLIAVFAWLFFLVVAIVRRYNRYAILAIGIVAVLVSAYQVAVLPDYFEQKRLYDDLIEVDPERGEEYQDAYEVEIDVTSDNVDRVFYNVRRGIEYEQDDFQEFDFENNDTLTITGGSLRGGYNLLLMIELKEGDRTVHEKFGLYFLNPPDED